MRLAPFTILSIKRITSRGDMELVRTGERKQVVFCVISDSDDTFNFLVGMLYTCAFQTLYFQADKVHGGSLPVPVRLLMDEFCTVALPDGFARLQATMRSRSISTAIVFQCIQAIGVIGIVQIDLSLKGRDASQRAQGFMCFFGGLLIAFAKPILDRLLA